MGQDVDWPLRAGLLGDQLPVAVALAAEADGVVFPIGAPGFGGNLGKDVAEGQRSLVVVEGQNLDAADGQPASGMGEASLEVGRNEMASQANADSRFLCLPGKSRDVARDA